MSKKRRRAESKLTEPSSIRESRTASSDVPAGTGLKGRRLWTFRLLALAIPVLLLLACEGILRLANFGYPSSFFSRWEVSGTNLFVNNPRFSRRFFPRILAPETRPFAIQEHKATNARRIFLFGESAALGDPDPRFGFGSMLKVMLRERFPQQTFELVNVSMIAINSHVIRSIAADCAGRGADIWVVYMGNNEVIGPFGAATVFGSKVPPLPLVRASLAAKRARTGQLMDAIVDATLFRSAKAGKAPPEWKGMEMFVGQSVRHDSPQIRAVHDNFRRNLDDILRLGQEAGAAVFLCTVGSNVRDCEPFVSLHRPGLSEESLAEWKAHYDQGRAMEGDRQFGPALAAYAKAAAIDDTFAELQFHLGTCLAETGESTKAENAFRLARDFDALQFRADTAINNSVREAAKATPGINLVDVEALMAKASRHQSPGRELFYEHVHFTPEGNYLIAQALAEAIVSYSHSPAGKETAACKFDETRQSPAWLTLGECLTQMGYTDQHELYSLNSMMNRIKRPPFTAQSNNPNQIRAFEETIKKRRGAGKQSRLKSSIPEIRSVLADHPDDADLRRNLADALELVSDYPGALSEWKIISELLPHYASAQYQIARLRELQGNPDQAIQDLAECLRRDAQFLPALQRIGVLLLRQGRTEEAIPKLKAALEGSPEAIDVRVALAQAYTRLGKTSKARAEAERVLQFDPGNVFARQILAES